MQLYDKYGKSLAVGDAVMVDGSRPIDTTIYPSWKGPTDLSYPKVGIIQAIGTWGELCLEDPTNNHSCGTCGSKAFAKFPHLNGYGIFSGCVLTKLDGEMQEEMNSQSNSSPQKVDVDE